MAEACRLEAHGPEYTVWWNELVRVTAVITDLITGEAIDPATVTFKYKVRSENTVTLVYPDDDEIVRKEAGVFYIDLPTGEVGPIYWRYECDGDFIAANEGQISVRPSGV